MAEDQSFLMPTVALAPNNRWKLEWDRKPEAMILSEFLQSRPDIGRLALIHNADEVTLKSIATDISSLSKLRVQPVRRQRGPYGHFCISVLSTYLDIERSILPRTTYELMKWTSSTEIYDGANSTLRALSNHIHRQRRAGAPITLRAALARVRTSPAYDSELLDEELGYAWAGDKPKASAFPGFLREDISKCPGFANAMADIILTIGISYMSKGWETLPISQIPVRIVAADIGRHAFRKAGVEAHRHVMTMGLRVLDAGEATDVLWPVIESAGLTGETEVVSQIMRGAGRYARINGSRVEPLFGEWDLSRAIDGIERAGTQRPNLSSIEPQSAPIDAYVDGEVLRLSGGGTPDTNTPLEYLEELRAQHLVEVERLAQQLAGANCGPGFPHRLDVTRRHLERPLTQASSLLLATTVRALEDMLPAVSESLTDLTAADVGATVSGLGLFVRQFPSWRSFLAEAQEQADLSDEMFGRLKMVAEAIQNQPDDVVEPALRQGLANVEEAAVSSGTSVLKFGLLRAVSNTLRAVGRYLRDRAIGAHAVFTKELEQRAGQLMAQTTLGLLIGGLSGALLEISTAFPHELGWIAGLLAFIKLHRRQ